VTDPLFRLDGRVAVVTGATGLLGRQHCHALAGAGATVVAVDISTSECVQFADHLGAQYGVSALGKAIDVCDPASLESLRQELLDVFGAIDVLVNNAAINDMVEDPLTVPERSRFEHYPLELWNAVLTVNVTGPFLCSQILGSSMAEAGRGSIINIASTYGIVAPDQSLYRRPDGGQAFYKSPSYPVSKGAVLALTRYLAAYWGEKGVRVNALSPGGVFNGQEEHFVASYARRTPLGRMAAPNDYRGAIVFLASDASSYMTGANLIVDGGWTIW
jgi:NAD(P)-dependent dehydrogenase (short-subunit alcohol dehydrogenase family)